MKGELWELRQGTRSEDGTKESDEDELCVDAVTGLGVCAPWRGTCPSSYAIVVKVSRAPAVGLGEIGSIDKGRRNVEVYFTPISKAQKISKNPNQNQRRDTVDRQKAENPRKAIKTLSLTT